MLAGICRLGVDRSNGWVYLQYMESNWKRVQIKVSGVPFHKMFEDQTTACGKSLAGKPQIVIDEPVKGKHGPCYNCWTANKMSRSH
jgi:hypothetical protein